MNFVTECLFFAAMQIVSGQTGGIVDRIIPSDHVNSLVVRPSQMSSNQPIRSSEQLAPFLTAPAFNTSCQVTGDCKRIDGNMYCYDSICYCERNYIYIYSVNQKCFRTARWEEECIFSYQCIVTTRNTDCRNGICTCRVGYVYNGMVCLPRSRKQSKATEVYTAALVAISCIMVAVTCILVGCVVKKSSQLRSYQNRPSQHSRGNDVFTVADEIAAVRAGDKPPTYDEVMRNEQMQFGIPPPDYPSSSSINHLPYASPIPGPSHSLRSASSHQIEETQEAATLATVPTLRQLSESSCSFDSTEQRTNEITSELSNITVELETNNSHTQTVPSPTITAPQQNRVNACSATDGELGAYANLAFSFDV